MFNTERQQLLISLKKKGDSPPCIQLQTGEKIDFTPGVAIFFKPRERWYHIDGDVQFFWMQ
jgi:hypothetical protein